MLDSFPHWLFIISFWKWWTYAYVLSPDSSPKFAPQAPTPVPPPPWGPTQYSQAGLVTLSSVFLLCFIWTSSIALFTLSQKYAPCLSLELSFLAFLTHISISSAWYSGIPTVHGAVQNRCYMKDSFINVMCFPKTRNGSSVCFILACHSFFPGP